MLNVFTRARTAVRTMLSSIATRRTKKAQHHNPMAWGALSKLLHWIVVTLIIVQWAIAKYAAGQSLGGKVVPLGLHKSIGISILAISIFRLTWRFVSVHPASEPTLKPWENSLAKACHVGLYALVFALPLTGWLMSSARNFPVSWFGFFRLPDLVSPDQALFAQMRSLHGVLFVALLLVALLHVLGALKHHFLDRNEVLLRMLPFARMGKTSRVADPR